LRKSYQDERKFHEDAIAKLQNKHRRIQDRIDAMYMDKLDGRIDNDFFDRKAGEFRSAQSRIMRDVEAHRTATTATSKTASSCWSWRTGRTRCSILSHEKRKLLDFVLSNSRWKDGRRKLTIGNPLI
jgi:hypothetical protein